MQIKSSAIKNLPVISLIHGKRVATIKDFLYDPFENRIIGFILHPNSLFGSDKYLLYPDVKSIGKDAMLIQSALSIKNLNEIDSNLLLLKKHGNLLTQGKLVTESGEKLGTVRDFLFDSSNGRVGQLEITQGRFADFKSGLKTINIANIVSIGPDATIVKIKALDDFANQSNPAGLQYKLNQTSDKLEDNLEHIKNKVTSYFRPNPYPDAPQNLSDLTKPAATDPTYNSNINSPTPLPAQPVKTFEPTSNISPNPTYPTKSPTQLDYEQAVEKLKDLSSDTRNKITALQNQAQTEYQSFKSSIQKQSEKTVEDNPTLEKQPEDNLSRYQAVAYNQISRLKNDRLEKQKKNALGLFLTKTILDDNDNILAKRGDIITNKLLSQAEHLDLVDQILKNTSYDPV